MRPPLLRQRSPSTDRRACRGGTSCPSITPCFACVLMQERTAACRSRARVGPQAAQSSTNTSVEPSSTLPPQSMASLIRPAFLPLNHTLDAPSSDDGHADELRKRRRHARPVCRRSRCRATYRSFRGREAVVFGSEIAFACSFGHVSLYLFRALETSFTEPQHRCVSTLAYIRLDVRLDDNRDPPRCIWCNRRHAHSFAALSSSARRCDRFRSGRP